jgi:methionyl-tRNA formyltransferase
VVVAYGLILPQAVLDAPRLGCLNIHASLLPRWRGAAPIQRAIMAGDVETGVCIMQMEAGLDTGPVLLRKALDIGPEETAGDLHDRLSALGAAAIVEALRDLDTLAPEPQPEDGVTYAAQDRQGRGEDRLDQGRGGYRPHDPGPFAFSRGVDHGRWQAREAVAGPCRRRIGFAGTILDDAQVACGTGALAMMQVQPEGKSPMSKEVGCVAPAWPPVPGWETRHDPLLVLRLPDACGHRGLSFRTLGLVA